MSTGKTNNRTYLRQDETTVLQSLLQEWYEQPDKTARDAFITATVLPQIQQLNLQDCGPDLISTSKAAKVKWESRISAVNNWLKNHRPFKERQVFKLERKIPLRRVVGKVKVAEIEAIIQDRHPDLHKGDKSYPGVYQQAVTEVMNKMDDEEMKSMQELLAEWQADGPPLDVRLKAGKKYGRKAIVNAHQLLDKEMYMSCITLSMAPEPESGAMGVTCHDYIADLHASSHGKRFKSFRDWAGSKYSMFMELIIDYANYVKEQKSEETEHGDGVVAPVVFEAGPGDLPLLPTPVHGVRSAEIAKQAKEVIRAYFLRHYKLATGCESARTPWAIIGEDPGKFFDKACLPAGFKFQDPSRMGASVKSLLTHLRHRQEQLGVSAFSFHHVLLNNELEPAQYPKSARAALTSVVPKIKKTEPEELGIPASNADLNASSDAKHVVPKTESLEVDISSSNTDPHPITSGQDIRMLDPALMAINQQNPVVHGISYAFPPSPFHQTGPHASSSTNPATPFNLSDPRYAVMFQHYMSQLGNLAQQGYPSLNLLEQHHGLPAPSFALPNSIPLPPPMLPYPILPPFQSFDPHPIPPGEPPFSNIFQPVLGGKTCGPEMPIGEHIRTPAKKNSSKTPRNTSGKTLGKRKRQEVDDTPSKQPTRVSSRYRTPKKHFEMD